MMVVGRLIRRVDVRLIMATGFALTALALWQMTRMNLEMDSTLVVVSGFVQGLGIGFTFVPLSTAAFATLAPALRNEGTPIFSLLRNIGGSVGISLAQTILTERAAQAHAQLMENVNAYNPALQQLPQALGAQTAQGLAALAREIDRQAAMIGYLDDFRLMMAVTLLAIPLLLLIRRPRAAPAAAVEAPH
jgi:DHA2 family multidrug resistance protein